MQKFVDEYHLIVVWRIGIVFLLLILIVELTITNRRLVELREDMPQFMEVEEHLVNVDEKLDQLHSDLEEISDLTSELIK